MIKNKKSKSVYKEKMQLAIENFKQAELEGAPEHAPVTYAWAKQKIYDDKKIILHYPDNIKKIEEASDDACAAAATLLSAVRRQLRTEEGSINHPPEVAEQEAIKDLINEGGPAR